MNLREAWRVAVAVIMVAAAGFAFPRYCLRPYRCKNAIPGLQARTARAADLSDTPDGRVLARRNLEELTALQRDCGDDLEWLMVFAANCRIVGQGDQAIVAYDRALSLYRRPELYYNRGMTRVEMGQIDAGARDLAVAVAFNPALIYELDPSVQQRIQAILGAKQ